MRFNLLFISFLLLGWSCTPSPEPTSVAGSFTDDFSQANVAWKPFALAGASGTYALEEGRLSLTSMAGTFGVYYEQTLSGHFAVEADFLEDRNVGLLLLQEKAGKPDPENYTMLVVDEQADGLVRVSVCDRQNGEENVLDNTGKFTEWLERRRQRASEQDEEEEILFAEDGYAHVLAGTHYSLPFKSTDKRLRILRDSNSGFFHYYYGVRATIGGQEGTDWMELRPSKDWAPEGSSFFVGLVALDTGTATFDGMVAEQKPAQDQDDRTTGFEVKKREYNWSGFIGDAVVVTFDDFFPYQDQDMKFVFWSEMNYIPAWHLNNQLLYTYEFVETWGGGNPGCHEPMSDRLRIWSRVEVLEDNPVRKQVHWHYVLCDPDYKVPENETGEQLPEVDEFWTFYPDGSGTRHIVYTPKLDSEHREAHELGEFISIAGSKHDSEEFYASPALTILNLEGEVQDAHPGPKFDYYSPIDDWNQQILAVHLNNLPDVFCAWSTDKAYPETYSGYQIRYENAWHNTEMAAVHWPVNKRPYTSAFSSGGLWEAEVSHACVLSWGVRDGMDWEDHFKVNPDGRKYREWVSLVGLSASKEYESMRKQTRSWLFNGKATPANANVAFSKVDFKKKALVFEAKAAGECAIQLEVEPSNSLLINPVIEIRKWTNGSVSAITLDGKALPTEGYRSFVTEDNQLLIWMKQVIEKDCRMVIKG